MTEAESRQWWIDNIYQPAIEHAECIGRGELPGDAEPVFTLPPGSWAEARVLGIPPATLAETERRLSRALARCAALAVKGDAPGESASGFERDFWAWRQGCGAA